MSWKSWRATRPSANSSAGVVHDMMELEKEYKTAELIKMYNPLRKNPESLGNWFFSYAATDIYPVVIDRLLRHKMIERIRKGIYVKL